ncbi:MAG: hypothetical protein R6U51_12775 [Anaerolineales bacterium]
MKRKDFKLALVASILMAVTIACGFSFSTANFDSTKMALDPEGEQPTTVFSPQDTFYAVVDLENAPDDTAVRAEWVAVDVEGEESDFMIESTETTTGSNQFHFYLENDSPWPAGDYQVNLYINDELQETLEFQVQK